MHATRRGWSSGLGRAATFVVGCAACIAVSGSFRVPSDIPRGVGYFDPAAYAAASAHGTIVLSKAFDWQPVPGTGGTDDMGYPILRQAWLLMGGDGSEATIAELHNVFVLACALAFAAAGAFMMQSPVAGWLCLASALALRHALRGLLFGALDNRTLIVVFPLAFVLLVVLVGPVTRRLPRPTAVVATLAFGGVVALADLLRHSEGLLAFYGLLVACLLLRVSRWRRLTAAGLVVLGSIALTYAVPTSVRLFNDLQSGRSARELLTDLRPIPPSYHSPWHTLQISLGRYPNPEGLSYTDLDGFVAVAKAFPDVVRRDGSYGAARHYYFWYVRRHPLAWLRALARGTLEVFYFIPYTLSVGSFPWMLGNLPAKEGVIPGLIVDTRDVACDRALFPGLCDVGHGSLVNLKLPYLKLAIAEWLVFAASLASIAAALRVTAVARDTERQRIFLALLCYTALGVGARALVPAYGQALVVAYFSVSILAVVFLLDVAWRARRTKDVVSEPVVPDRRQRG